MFDWKQYWKQFWSVFMLTLGSIGILVASIAACEESDVLLFLWAIPGIVAVAAGIAIVD